VPRGPTSGKRPSRSAARGSRATTQLLRKLGVRLRALREAKGLTQESAADAAQLDAKHLQDIEYGRTNPTVASLSGLAQAYGVTLSQLFEGV
jgi:transcriptional regulator with XRE-family HTH domain